MNYSFFFFYIFSFLCYFSFLLSLKLSHKSVTLFSYPFNSYNSYNSFNSNSSNFTLFIAAPISFQSTDTYFSYGLVMSNSWNMFIEWINYNKNGININNQKYYLSLTYIEDYSNQIYVKELCQDFINNKNILYLFGPYSSSLNSACSSVTESNNMFIFSGGSSDTAIFRNSNYLFGTLPGGVRYVSAVFELLDDLGAQTVAVFRDSNYPSCDDAAISGAEIITNVTVYDIYDLDVNSPLYKEQLLAILLQLKLNGVETVYGCSYSTMCIELPSLARSINYNPNAILFTSCLSSSSVLQSLGEDSHYLFAVTPWTPTNQIVDKYTGWTAEEFSQKYTTMYNTAPTYHAASTFAAAESLVIALEKCQCINDTQALLTTLENTYFETFYANFTYNNDHQAVFKMAITQMLNHNDSWTFDLVNSHTAVYPAPTWAQRDCIKSTNDCSSHGKCNTTGYCVCDPGYYGAINYLSCDTSCDGEIVNGKCRANTILYIGGMVAYQYAEGPEYQANMRLAVELINNKNDGWFDNNTAQIHFIMQLNNSGCDSEQAVVCLDYQNDWAIQKHNAPLDGLIGAECSAGSISTAALGNSLTLPQISFKSSTTELSDKDLYPYFARTCASDAAQGPALTNLLINLGISPYVALVSTTDGYGVSMSESFASSYESSGNIILVNIVYTPSSTTDYDEIITQIAQSGAPAIVLVVYPEEVEKILKAASKHSVLSSNSVIWIGADSWIDLELNVTLPNGIIGVSAYQADNPQTIKYTELWKSLDPVKYPDTDGDRSTFSTYSLYIMDAVTALALAYQKAIDDATGLTGSQLRQYVYNALVKDIAFVGVSGNINFDAQGDLTNPQFRVVNYDSNIGWKTIGVATSSSIVFTDEMVWPDNTISNSYNGYSNQLIPYCSPGEEPVLGSNGVYICSLCNVGYYSPYWASEKCKVCPIGTDCNDVGIVIPCLLENYWRSIPNTYEEEGDFDTYQVYPCDQQDSCLGGCKFNSSCSTNRNHMSPTCGVCIEGYYMTEGQCYKCTVFKSSYSILLFWYLLITLIFSMCLFGIIWYHIKSTLPQINIISSSNDLSISNSGDSRNDNRSDNNNNNNDNNNDSNQRQSQLPQRQTFQTRVSTILNLKRVSLFFDNNQNRSARKKLFRGTSMTFKLVLSFIQVISGSFYTVNMHWSNKTKDLLNFLNINPLHAINASYQCSTMKLSSDFRHFLVLVVYFLIPLFFLIILYIVSYLVYIYGMKYLSKDNLSNSPRESNIPSLRLSNIRETNHSESSVYSLSSNKSENISQSLKNNDKLRQDVWNISAKIFLWFCLISYPSLSSGMLSVFNCRDLGVTGIYLRQDYSVSCDSSQYKNSVVIASLGTVLYPVGIPILFYFIIKHRHHPLLASPSLLLYQNFAQEWVFYEVYDLIRKLLLTSVMPFISPPDTPSQCLYLLCVDMLALIILAYSRPYANEYDDILSGFLIAVECILFLLALVIVSGISEVDNYNESALYNTAFVIVLITLGCVMPWTLAMKFTYMRNKMNTFVNIFKQRALSIGISLPNLHRLDAKYRMSEDINQILTNRPISETYISNEDIHIKINPMSNNGNNNNDINNENPTNPILQRDSSKLTPKDRLMIYNLNNTNNLVNSNNVNGNIYRNSYNKNNNNNNINNNQNNQNNNYKDNNNEEISNTISKFNISKDIDRQSMEYRPSKNEIRPSFDIEKDSHVNL